MRLRDGSVDIARCGPGRDVARQDEDDFLLRGCEVHRSRQPTLALPLNALDVGSALVVELVCPSGRERSCDGQATIEGLPGATEHFSVGSGHLGLVRVPLAEGRESPDPSLEEATLVVSSTDPRGLVAESRFRLGDLFALYPPPLVLPP